ncbi:patatin-like phospholipase family protein [Carboxylicivirga sp. N1Y90]|uniref:patatin-like phospholipase family protein n=1 Tax=Carboxylicivirga fragile TaxID=3417571 RepID=UPI003D338A4F|nr:patatin-like phospholipase family protein [Marinilabiliaceae bacterium N1Y90]
MPTPDHPLHLFRNIALCFSGGGFRAAGYSLGVLSYLNHVKFNGNTLLSHVKALSTVSGGTITGVAYAKAAAQGVSFDNFEKQIYDFLNNKDLLEMALTKLSDDAFWKQTSKKRTLINAFALGYRELVDTDEFDLFDQNKPGLEDVVFNATDCSYGLAFRFKNSDMFGNYRLFSKQLTALSKKIKLADIIASSSCFPMGFAPIIMPDDFIDDHRSKLYTDVKGLIDFENGLGLMDGGIVDNQGIGSIRLADSNRPVDNKFDLILVCDVSSYKMEPWQPSSMEVDKPLLNKTLQHYRLQIDKKIKAWWWIILPVLISVVSIVFGTINHPLIIASAGVFGAISLVAIVVKVILSYAKGKVEKEWEALMSPKLIPKVISKVIPKFERLRLRLLKRMLTERFSSSLKMVNDMFLKQIRRLNYRLLYTDEALTNRRSSAMIYDLTEAQYTNSVSDEQDKVVHPASIPNPGYKIYEIAEAASSFATTLWFTKKDREDQMLDKLVTCGQFTVCYNLLKYCLDLKKDGADVDQTELDEVTKLLKADWERFIDDPYWLLKA